MSLAYDVKSIPSRPFSSCCSRPALGSTPGRPPPQMTSSFPTPRMVNVFKEMSKSVKSRNTSHHLNITTVNIFQTFPPNLLFPFNIVWLCCVYNVDSCFFSFSILTQSLSHVIMLPCFLTAELSIWLTLMVPPLAVASSPSEFGPSLPLPTHPLPLPSQKYDLHLVTSDCWPFPNHTLSCLPAFAYANPSALCCLMKSPHYLLSQL